MQAQYASHNVPIEVFISDEFEHEPSVGVTSRQQSFPNAYRVKSCFILLPNPFCFFALLMNIGIYFIPVLEIVPNHKIDIR